MARELNPAVELMLLKAQDDKMYGTIEIKFENGVVVLIRESTTYKPQSYRASRDDEGER